MPPPKTMIHPETGAPLRRRKRREVVAYMDLTRAVQARAGSPKMMAMAFCSALMPYHSIRRLPR